MNPYEYFSLQTFLIVTLFLILLLITGMFPKGVTGAILAIALVFSFVGVILHGVNFLFKARDRNPD